MYVMPSIDLMHGQPVRLLRGDYASVTTYSDTPADVAKRWRDAGAELIHIVDLEGSRDGRMANMDVLREILMVEGMRVQVGGGVRSVESVRHLFEWGAERVVIGTAIFETPGLLELACAEFPGRIVAALDSRAGTVAVRGWEESSGISLSDATELVQRAGASRILFTAIETDGTLAGPDISAIESLVYEAEIPVIASGGVGSVEHLEALARTGVEAAIVGRALYEGKVSLEAIRKYSAQLR